VALIRAPRFVLIHPSLRGSSCARTFRWRSFGSFAGAGGPRAAVARPDLTKITVFRETAAVSFPLPGRLSDFQLCKLLHANAAHNLGLNGLDRGVSSVGTKRQTNYDTFGTLAR
jgi:hypothetical protein